MSILLQKTVSITVKDVIGTIDVVNVLELQADKAKISFKRYQSTLLMWAPISWLFTKDSAGAQEIKKGSVCSANIPLTVTTSIRGATVLEVGTSYILVQAGNRLRLVPFQRITNCYHNIEKTTGAVAVVQRAVRRPAALENPAASAPVAAPRARAAGAKAPVPVRGR